jgi:hypothetical protein
VAETVSVGKRVIVVRCEVSTHPATLGWDVDGLNLKIYEIETGHIVASGQQVKIAPQSTNVSLNVPMALL